MRVAVNCCRGLWLLLNVVWAQDSLRQCLRMLRESQAAKRADWVHSDRASVRFWIRAVRGWRADLCDETFEREVCA